MHLLFIFLDGVGHGVPDPTVNPFANTPTPTLDQLAGGSFLEPTTPQLDARLDMPGLPQSATGQASLLTGRNAAHAMGRHYGPWPGPTLHTFLAEGNLFQRALHHFGTDGVRWASAYPDGFFRALARRALRLNAPAHCAHEAGIELPTLDAYTRGEAVAADLDGAAFAAWGVTPPGGHATGPEGAHAAGVRLAELASQRAFTFLDVWTTDRAGHAADAHAARTLITNLDAFLAGALEARGEHVTLLVTSDHGNLEDLTHGRHTMAPVPLLTQGPQADAFAHARSILDVAPVIEAHWRERAGNA